MPPTPARFTTITTPYGEARVNANGRILWAEWEVWRHSEELVASGAWTRKSSNFGARERVEFYAGPHTGSRSGARAAATEDASR